MRLSKRSLASSTTGDLCKVPCFKEDVVARVRASIPPDEELERARAVFGALADRTRLRILYALRSGEELCVCDISHVLGMSVALASHHLRKLLDLGLLEHRSDGKMAYYSMRDRSTVKMVDRVVLRGAS